MIGCSDSLPGNLGNHIRGQRRKKNNMRTISLLRFWGSLRYWLSWKRSGDRFPTANSPVLFQANLHVELIPRGVLTANKQKRRRQGFGIGRLTAETSVNLGGGITARPSRISIDDRIVQTSRLSASNEAYGAILEPFWRAGVPQSQFSPTR